MPRERLIINGRGITREVIQSTTVEAPDKKQVQTPTRRSVLTRMIDDQRARRAEEVSQDEATVKIKTGLKRIGILFTGDWHIGSDKTDYETWDRHQTLVAETPGMHEAIVGDERDNFVTPKFRQGLYEGVLNPQEQANFVMDHLKDLDAKDKIVARVGGNHDNWTWEGSGIDFESFWYRGMKSPLLRNGGFVHLEVNDVKYEVYLHHGQSLFNSNFNPNHATRRAYEMQGEFDIGALGHKHVSEVAHGYKGSDSKQKDVLFVRTGTYKTADQYSRSKQLGRGQPAGATVVLDTRKRHMMGFRRVEDAVEVMNALNEAEVPKVRKAPKVEQVKKPEPPKRRILRIGNGRK